MLSYTVYLVWHCLVLWHDRHEAHPAVPAMVGSDRRRWVDGRVVDHGDDGHGEVDAHGVDVGEAEAGEERKHLAHGPEAGGRGALWLADIA